MAQHILTTFKCSLPSSGWLAQVPRAAWLDGAAHPHHVQVLAPILWLVGPGLLHLGQAKGEGDGVSQERHESPLLQLVAKNWGVRESSGTNSESGSCVADSNR